MRLPRRWAGAALCLGVVLPGLCAAQMADEQQADVKFQLTYNWQRHGSFRQSYSAANSMSPVRDKMYTFSTTAHIGGRPWQGGEVYFNPEIAQGVPFGGILVGLGGFTNGEITRAAGTNPTIYRQRLFLRQTWNHGGGSEKVDSDFNQLAGSVDKNRFVLTVGNFSTLDVFDDNAYAKDPRAQFMNWSHWTYAAFDYAADARGFGWGFAGEWYRDDWVVRFGRMTGPREPNGLPTDFAIGRHYGDQVEVERAYTLFGQPGRARVLAWRNRAVLASFSDALAFMRANPGGNPQAFFAVRGAPKIKYGIGVNLEQSLGRDGGVFLRAMKADGKTETHAFTEVDGSLSVGGSIKGKSWGRAGDTVGIAFARNTLSDERRRYLEAGGISFFIGDGALNYRPEQILETYYSVGVTKSLWFTFDVQHIRNPAYNADRGPVNVLAFRLHAHF